MHITTSARLGLLGLVVAVGLAGCSAPSAPPQKTSLVIAGATAINYDPFNGGNGPFDTPAVQAVYDTLFFNRGSLEEGALMLPWLASGYTLSEDKMHMEVTLRDDVVFTDGERLTAEGVVKVLEKDFILPGFGAEYEVTGEYTFEMTLTKPFDNVAIDTFVNRAIPSPSAIDDPDSLADTPVGSGPYLLDAENSTPGVELNYTRNPDYWNAEAFPYDTLKIVTFDDNVAALNALKSGQIDATVVDIAAVAEAEGAGFSVTIAQPTYRTLIFGGADSAAQSPVADVRVRRAINLAFDRATIAEVLDLGHGGVSSQPFTAGQAEYLEGEDDRYGYDPERARELLAEAGYPDGFELQIPTVAGFTTAFEPVMQQSLADIGITVTYVPMADFGEYIARLKEFPAIAFENYFVNTVRLVLQGEGDFQTWFNAGPEYDGLITTILGGTADASAEASQELGELLLDDARYAPFSRVPKAWAAVDGLEVELDPVTAAIDLSMIGPAS